jgi:hypothetical protein
VITIGTCLDNVQPLSYSWFDLDSLHDHDIDVHLIIRLAQPKGRSGNRQEPRASPEQTSEVAMIVVRDGACVYDKLWRRTCPLGNGYRYDSGVYRAAGSAQKTILTVTAKENLKRNASRLLGIGI